MLKEAKIENGAFDRMHRLRSAALEIYDRQCRGRLKLLQYRAFQAHQNEPVHNIRQARVIAHILEHYPIEIRDEDLLVGRYSTVVLSDDEALEVKNADHLLGVFQRGLLFRPGSGGVGGHRTVDFEKMLRLGVQGVLDEALERDATIDYTCPSDAEKANFYLAARISLNGLLRFADRWREELEKRAAAESSVPRRLELERLAGIFARVPRFPARDFYEALQAVWFTQFALGLADDVSCTGRPDNYLLPYYERDLSAGNITRDFALRLVEELYLRSNEVYGHWPETIMLGGVDRKGEPVQNELTYMFIQAVETVGLVNPNVALCYREDTPDELLIECLDKIARGYSHPALYNDRVITEGLIEAGLPPEDARYYQNSTCVEITPIGNSNVQVAMVDIPAAKALELALNEGRLMVEQKMRLMNRVGAEAVEKWTRPIEEGGARVDLESLTSFEAFYCAYKTVLAQLIRGNALWAIQQTYRTVTVGSCPLVSCFVDDCLARGRDVAAGGARHNDWGCHVPGFSTVVDSLAAIRAAVFRDRFLTFSRLREALLRNYEGAEEVRQYLLRRCPKYGADDPNADDLAVDLYNFIVGELDKYRTCLGGRFHIGVFSGWGWPDEEGKRRSANVAHGSVTAATPDGRFAGTPLSENIGPAPGADLKGLTALANSVTKLDHRRGLGGISLNLRFDRGMLTKDYDRRKLIGFLRDFMRKGVFEIQMNAVDSETLRAARQNPEQYRTLSVRIAGYSDYFWNLNEEMQESIINRVQHEKAAS
jgi:formate C-acetyltransferase